MKRQSHHHTSGHAGFKAKKVYQYCTEDANGNKIWVNYNPKTYTPDGDTRVI